MVANTVFRLFQALLPLAMLWVSKLIIDGVVAWITLHSGNLVGIWKLVALELAVAIASDMLGRANTLSSSAMWGSPTRDATGWLSKTLTLRCIAMKNWY